MLIVVIENQDTPELAHDNRRSWEFLVDTPRPRAPNPVNELIAFMALPPGAMDNIERRRWSLLYQTAVWALWKAIYLTPLRSLMLIGIPLPRSNIIEN